MSLDSGTYYYLARLKASNQLWLMALRNCAKKSPRLAKKCLDEIHKNLTYVDLDPKDVNIFTLCKAANEGILDNFGEFISSQPWELWRHKMAIRINRDIFK